MFDETLCSEVEYKAVAGAVADAMDAGRKPSAGCVLMVGMSLVAGVLSQLSEASRAQVLAMVGELVSPGGHGNQMAA